MKKAKLVFWFLLVGLVALFLFQNLDYFLAKNSLQFDLYFARYHTPAFPNGSMAVAFFVIGFLMAYALSLSNRFRTKKTIKQLNETIAKQRETISSSKREERQMKTEVEKEAQVTSENQSMSESGEQSRAG